MGLMGLIDARPHPAERGDHCSKAGRLMNVSFERNAVVRGSSDNAGNRKKRAAIEF